MRHLGSGALVRIAAFATLLAACGSPSAQKAEAPTLPAQGEVAGQASDASSGENVEARGRRMAARLAVRHTSDLPGAEELRKVEGADLALVWVANHADAMVVRARALALLRHVPTVAARTELTAHVGSPDKHPVLRAGAVRGLAPFLGRDDVVELLTGALRDTDPRVAHAAAEVLATAPALAPLLTAAAADPEVIESLRTELQSHGSPKE